MKINCIKIESIEINKHQVIEVIGRLIGRANSHKNAANQTSNEKKAAAHLVAASDLFSLADDLANATNQPDFVKSHTAYKQAVSHNK